MALVKEKLQNFKFCPTQAMHDRDRYMEWVILVPSYLYKPLFLSSCKFQRYNTLHGVLHPHSSSVKQIKMPSSDGDPGQGSALKHLTFKESCEKLISPPWRPAKGVSGPYSNTSPHVSPLELYASLMKCAPSQSLSQRAWQMGVFTF